MNDEKGFAEILAELEETEIKSSSDLEMCGFLALELKGNLDAIAAKEKEAIGDLAKELAALKKPFAGPKKFAKACIDKAKGRILEYKALLDGYQEALMQAAAEGDQEAAEELAEVPEFALPAGVSIRRDQAWRVADFERVPIKYLTIDEKAIAADLKAGQKIDGIEFYEKDIVVLKGAK